MIPGHRWVHRSLDPILISSVNQYYITPESLQFQFRRDESSWGRQRRVTFWGSHWIIMHLKTRTTNIPKTLGQSHLKSLVQQMAVNNKCRVWPLHRDTGTIRSQRLAVNRGRDRRVRGHLVQFDKSSNLAIKFHDNQKLSIDLFDL
jgi:hypothetical protein